MQDHWHVDLSLDNPRELHSLFAKCAEITPDNIAVAHGRELITYKELDILSNRFADFMAGAYGVEPGDLVAVSYERGMNFILSILSILKCGAAYVPIDVKEPDDRRTFILNEIDPKLSLVQKKYRDDFDFDNAFCIEDMRDVYQYSPYPRHIHCREEDTACVFYTSGSTGQPKGVVLPHRALTGLIRNPRYLTITEHDRVLSSSSIAFDAASFEIWTALANSATLVCVDYETILNPEAFADFLDREEITVMWVTSALFDQLVSFRPGMFKKVKYLLSGGDVINPKTVYKVLNNAQGRPRAFINGYGPTETGILATFHMVTELADDNTPIPIGKALADSFLFVLDESMKPVPVGEPGELYIGGHRLAKGYLNLPEKTAQSFVKNPFTGNPTDTLYKTGDLVRFLDDGSLDFIGRADRQIKFRGFRLELDGIENVMIGYPRVANAAVKMIELHNEKVLAGYIQPEQGKTFSLEDYKAYLKEKMPSYMVPYFLVVMETLPITQRGKIDRKKLPDPVIEDKPRAFAVQPRTELERLLYEVWSESLGRKAFGVTDNFFELGGTSIKLAGVYAKIREQIDTPFSLETFLRNPTIEMLAQSIEHHSGDRDDSAQAQADAVLPPAVKPASSAPSAVRDGSILLTGSTGFLGGHLLAEILTATDKPVYCLVRPREGASLIDHQMEILKKLKLTKALEAAERIRPVAGDLGEHGLGLGTLDHDRVVDHVSHIVHCGAYVHHIFTYPRLRKENTLSTLELIKIAMARVPKKLAFVSTASAITEENGEGVGYEDRVGKQPASFFGGYAMSKWVSERLMQQAFQRGMSGLILRPGNIFANSETGVTSPPQSNFALLMLRCFVQSGLAPDMDFYFEAVPVDVLAKAIVAAALSPDCDRRILNLPNPLQIPLSEYLDLISGIVRKKIEIVPFSEWKKRVIDPLKEDSPLYPLTLYFQEGPGKEIFRFETAKTQSELLRLGVTYPKDYRSLLKDVFDKTLKNAFGIG